MLTHSVKLPLTEPSATENFLMRLLSKYIIIRREVSSIPKRYTAILHVAKLDKLLDK